MPARDGRNKKQTKTQVKIGPISLVIDSGWNTPTHIADQGESGTGLLLVPKLFGVELGEDQRIIDQQLSGVISREIKKKKFTGEKGKMLHIDTELPDSPYRHLLVIGLGSCEHFDMNAVCSVYQQLVDTALNLGVTRITVPFPKHRATSGSGITLPGMANVFKRVMMQKLASSAAARKAKKRTRARQELRLKEVHFHCGSGVAKHYLEKGLNV